MKRISIFIVLVAFMQLAVNSQNTFPSSGNTGIGTSSPSYLLHVTATGSAGSGSNYGTWIGTDQTAASTGTTAALVSYGKTSHSSGTVAVATGYLGMSHLSGAGAVTNMRGVQGGAWVSSTGSATNGSAFYASFATTSSGTITNGYGLYVESFPSGVTNKWGVYVPDANAKNHFNGSVAIGTTADNGYKLAVNGSAIFTEAKVKLYANWPDYVFTNEYALMPLTELEQFIRQHKHLPNMPSEAKMNADGAINLGEMTTKLLEKVEELTLYIIELKKENDAIKRQLEKVSTTK